MKDLVGLILMPCCVSVDYSIDLSFANIVYYDSPQVFVMYS